MEYKMDSYAPRPIVFVGGADVPAPFAGASINGHSKLLLSMASNFRIHGANLYKLVSNKDLAKSLGIKLGPFMRCKRELRDKDLLNYDCEPGDYTELVKRWERISGHKWIYPL